MPPLWEETWDLPGSKQGQGQGQGHGQGRTVFDVDRYAGQSAIQSLYGLVTTASIGEASRYIVRVQVEWIAKRPRVLCRVLISRLLLSVLSPG